MSSDKNIGRIVLARVTRIEEYALYLDFDTGGLIVLVPDVAAGPLRLKEAWKVGDEARVRIWRYVESERLYKGTIREAESDGPAAETLSRMPINILTTLAQCPHCNIVCPQNIELDLDGQGMSHADYSIGETVDWLPGRSPEEGGRPADGTVDKDGYVVCSSCERDFFVIVQIRNDKIALATVNAAKPGHMPPEIE